MEEVKSLPIPPSPPATYYGYERLKYGKNRACCKGFCVTGPGHPRASIVILNILCLYVNVGWYVYLAPYYFLHINAAPPVLAIIFGLLC